MVNSVLACKCDLQFNVSILAARLGSNIHCQTPPTLPQAPCPIITCHTQVSVSSLNLLLIYMYVLLQELTNCLYPNICASIITYQLSISLHLFVLLQELTNCLYPNICASYKNSPTVYIPTFVLLQELTKCLYPYIYLCFYKNLPNVYITTYIWASIPTYICPSTRTYCVYPNICASIRTYQLSISQRLCFYMNLPTVYIPTFVLLQELTNCLYPYLFASTRTHQRSISLNIFVHLQELTNCLCPFPKIGAHYTKVYDMLYHTVPQFWELTKILKSPFSSTLCDICHFLQ